MNTTVKLCTLAVLLLASEIAAATQLPGPLVDAAWLEKNLAGVTVLDVRSDIKSFTTAPMYTRDMKTGQQRLARIGGHIPGALITSYKHVRRARLIDGNRATRMLPDKKDFEYFMQLVGLNKDRAVVIVSKGEGVGDILRQTIVKRPSERPRRSGSRRGPPGMAQPFPRAATPSRDAWAAPSGRAVGRPFAALRRLAIGNAMAAPSRLATDRPTTR